MPETSACATTDSLWTGRLLEQLTWHWEAQLRPKLVGLSDDEYRWEPVPGCWSLRPRSEAATPMAAGGGDVVADFAFPEPTPSPVTTIAWRLGHLIVGIFGERNAAHFGGPPMTYQSYRWSLSADDALAALDDGYGRWIDGVAALGDAGLERPIGPRRGHGRTAPTPSSSSTSTERCSTTAPRCCSCGTCTGAGREPDRPHS